MLVVKLKPGIWIPEGNSVPGGVIYEGAGPETVIQAADPETEFIYIGPQTILRNVSIHDVYGAQNPLAMLNKPNGPRPVTYLENAHLTDMISTHWAWTSSYVSGGQEGVDSPISIIRSRGSWSACQYCEAHGQTYCFHAWAIDQSKGLLVEHFDESTGIQVIAKAEARPLYGSLTMLPEANVRSIFIQPVVDTTTDMQLVSEHKTEGSWIAFYHAVSKFAGSLFHANMGNGEGEFSGFIFDIINKGRAVFRMDAQGNVTEGGLAEKIKELEARLDALEGR